MGLDSDCEICYHWNREHLIYDGQNDVNVFETTIHEMGGLLASHALKKEPFALSGGRPLG
jgi:hypothetical protein